MLVTIQQNHAILKTDSISADDLTISIIRQSKPEKFLKLLQEKLYMITNPYPGIYYIQKDGFFATQLIITKELDTRLHRWLTALTNQLKLSDIEQLIYTMDELTEKDEKEYAKSVLTVAFKANKNKLGTLKEVEPNMEEAFEVFYEVFKSDIDKRVSDAVFKTAQESNAKWLVQSVEAIMTKLQLSLDKACDTLGHTITEYKEAKLLLENMVHSGD